MEYTKNLKLKQPEYTDVADIADINANMETIDTAFENLKNADTTHESNFLNPHKVTKAQVGLGNVDNTADKDKNVLSASKLTNAVKINDTAFDGTKDIDISANPKRISIASDADLNEITTQGEYFASYGNNCLNKPTGVKGFALKVYWNIVGSPSALTQVLFPSVGNKALCFIRKANSNGWLDWEEISTVGHTHTQADITDFNAPVYLELPDGSESVDLNDITEPGVYCSLSSVKYENCPLDITIQQNNSDVKIYSFILIVCKSNTRPSTHAGGYITQIYINTWNKGCETFIRNKWGTWGSWSKYYSSSNKPTLEDIVGSTVLPASKGGTGFSTISAGYALVGNGTSAQLGTRYINSSVEEKSNDIVTGGAVYNALEKFNTLSKSSYVVAASDSDEILKKYADYVCDGVKDEEEIQKAIDTSPVGSEIKLLAGHYNMNNPISINKQISLIGSGLNTVITSTRKTVDGLYLMHAIYINYNGKNVLGGVNISNFKLSRGLCSLNGKFYDGTGSIYTEEFPTYYRS